MESDRLFLLQWLFPFTPSLVQATHQDHFKGGAEGLVAEGVAHGVHCAVDVAQPVAYIPQGLWNAVLAEGVDQYHDVVGSPCDDECKQDGAQGLSGFLLLHQRHALALGDLASRSHRKAPCESRFFERDGHGG